MKRINKELAELAAEAKAKGICKEWYDRLKRTEDKHALIRMFLKGIDFCISEDYPSPRFFGIFNGIRQQYGIFRDESVQTDNSAYVVAFGKCEGSVNYSGFCTGQIFVKDETELTVTASGNAFVMIDIFDDAKIEIEAKDSAKICVNQYGGNITPVKSGNATIKVIHKISKTY